MDENLAHVIENTLRIVQIVQWLIVHPKPAGKFFDDNATI